MRRYRNIITRIWLPLTLIGAMYLASSTLYYTLESGLKGGPKDYGDALWYGLVTMSTVGYGDIYPQTGLGRLVGAALVLFSLGALGFLVGRIGETIVEEKRREELGLNGTTFTHHIAILGWSLTSEVALGELLAVGERVAVICGSDELHLRLRHRAGPKQLFLLRGESKDETSLQLVNINSARTVIVASDDDTRNLIIALNVARMNPDAQLIVSIRNTELHETFSSAGVTYVANPFEFSGRLMASAAFEPEVAQLIEDISSSKPEGYDLQQHDVKAPYAGMSVHDFRAAMDKIGGPLLMAVVRRGDGGYFRPNPTRDLVIIEGDIIIVLTNPVESARLTAALTG